MLSLFLFLFSHTLSLSVFPMLSSSASHFLGLTTTPTPPLSQILLHSTSKPYLPKRWACVVMNTLVCIVCSPTKRQVQTSGRLGRFLWVSPAGLCPNQKGLHSWSTRIQQYVEVIHCGAPRVSAKLLALDLVFPKWYSFPSIDGVLPLMCIWRAILWRACCFVMLLVVYSWHSSTIYCQGGSQCG